MIRLTEWKDYYRISEMFLDWPMDEKGPCTPERTRVHMQTWFALDEWRSFVYTVDNVVLGCINVKGFEITHAAIHPDARGLHNFSKMTTEFAELVISQGFEEMNFEALDQASFIADKYHKHGTRNGVTGLLHQATVVKGDFDVA